MKLKNLHIYFFYFFLFSIPFQTRKVFLTKYSFYTDSFTEWTTLFIYMSDIFLILAIFSWFILLLVNFYKYYHSNENIKSKITSFFLFYPKKPLCDKFRKIIKNSKSFLFLAIFFILAVLSVFINNNYFEIGIFQIIKLLELACLIAFVNFNLKNKNTLNNSLFILISAGFLQSIIAIFQFVFQRSLSSSPFMFKITGESFLGPQIPGVAKMTIDGENIIRAYGTFPHPNVFASFLIFTIAITIYFYLEHKKYYLLSEKHSITSLVSKNFLRLFKYNNINYIKCQCWMSSLFWITLIFVQIMALFLTFSRIAWLGFLFFIFTMVVIAFYNIIIVSRETITDIKHNIRNIVFRFKELFIVIFLLFILIISNFSIIATRINDKLFDKNILSYNSAITTRNFYNIVSRETILDNFFFGSGLGTYIFQIDIHLKENNFAYPLKSWQYQPAHNIYLLIASEIGFFGLIFFLFILISIFLNFFNIVSRETILDRKLNIYLLVIFLSFLLMGLFDHYFWTIQQGKLIFWLLFAFLLMYNYFYSQKK